MPHPNPPLTWTGRAKTLLARRGMALAILPAVLLAGPGLFFGLLVDDLFHHALLLRAPFAVGYFASPLAMYNFVDGNPAHTQALMDVGFLPWWTLPEARFTFLRPVSVFTHLVDYRLWPDSLALMHLHSLAWMAALAALAYTLYRRIHGAGWVAGLAALLYAVDDAHAIPATWLANRNALLAAVFGMLALLTHIRWRRGADDADGAAERLPRGEKGGRCLYFLKQPLFSKSLSKKIWVVSPFFFAVAGPLCLALSVLANEGGIASCAFLFAYAVCLDRGHWLKRLATLLPYAAVIVVWRAYYSAHGFGVRGAEVYVDPLAAPGKFLALLAERVPMLLFGQWLFPMLDVHLFLPRPVQLALLAAALTFLAMLAALAWPLLRRSAEARFWALAMALAAVPASATFVMDRMLLFIGIAGMALLALLAADIFETRAGHVRKAARIAVAALLAVHLIGGPVLMPLKLGGFYLLGRPMTTCIQGADFGDGIQDKTVLCVNAPMVFYTSYLLPSLSVQGKPLPKRVRGLAPNNGFPTPIRLTRTDANTLAVWGAKGYPLYNVRSLDDAFAIGEQVRLEGVTITVQSLTANGWPQDVAFRFDVPLDDPSLVWTQVQDNIFVPFAPPPIGESVFFNQ